MSIKESLFFTILFASIYTGLLVRFLAYRRNTVGLVFLELVCASMALLWWIHGLGYIILLYNYDFLLVNKLFKWSGWLGAVPAIVILAAEIIDRKEPTK